MGATKNCTGRGKFHQAAWVGATLIWVACGASVALAADFHWWGAGTGGITATDPSDPVTQWNQDANWLENQVPGSLDNAHLLLSNAGYVNAATGSIRDLYVDGTASLGAFRVGAGVDFTCGYTYLGYQDNSIGNAVQDGGKLTISSSFWLGYGSGSSSNYTLLGGELIVNNGELGFYGTGTFAQSGGTHTVGYNLRVGVVSNANGTYHLSDGDLVVRGKILVARQGTGTFTQTGGTHTVDSGLYLGYYSAGSNGTYSLSGGSLTSNSNEYIGYGGTGIFTQSAGEHIANLATFLGYESGSSGAYTLSDGTHRISAALTLGYSSGAGGSYSMTGGTLSTGLTLLGFSGAGQFTQIGGTHQVSDGVQLGWTAGGSGTYTLGAGDLTVGGSVTVGAGGTGTLNIDGGSLVAGNIFVGATSGNGTLNLNSGSASVEINGNLTLGGNATLGAADGAKIRMTGAAFQNESTNAAALVGLSNLEMVFQGGTEDIDPFEVAGQDVGCTTGGWIDNFALGTLTLGAGPGMEGRIQLVDNIDNQVDGPANEALYVSTLGINTGAAIDLNGLSLYYLNSGAPKQLLHGDCDLDGDVDDEDLAFLLNSWGESGKDWADGDFTGEGDVNDLDLAQLLNNWGAGVPVTAIPEPASAVLLLIGLPWLVRRRMRRR